MKFVIVGNNVSGITCAKKLRESDADAGAEITVLSAEQFPYYTRPKLIDLLSGECDEQSLFFYPQTWYEKNRIDVRLETKVSSVDVAGKLVMTAKGPFSFDRLVLATGAESFMPPVQGRELEGVFTLRTIIDARKIRAWAEKSSKAVVVGGGVLGLEIANALKKISPGMEIHVLEIMDQLLPRQLDRQGGDFLAGILGKNGIHLLISVKVKGFGGGGTVSSVELENRTLDADMVVVSAGVRPNLRYLEGSGIKTNRGILVDCFLRTSVENVFAIGDCAEYEGRVYGMIRPAMDMASCVATNAVKDGSVEYQGSPVWNTTKALGQFIVSMGEYGGDEGKSEVIRSVTEGAYRKFVIEGNRLKGFISVGRRVSESKVSRMIGEGKDIGGMKERFKDPGFEF